MAKNNNDIRFRVLEYTKKYVRRVNGQWILNHPLCYGKVIDNEFDLYQLKKELMKLSEVCFDTETTSLRVMYPGEADIVGMSFSWGKHHNYYIPMGHLVEDDEAQLPVETVVRVLKPFFEREDVRLIGHNLKFDFHVLANYGVVVKTRDIFDTMVASWNVDENEEKNLEDCVKRYYDYDKFHFKDILTTIPNEVKKEYGYKANQNVPCSLCKIKYLAPYAMEDTFWAWRMYVDIQDVMEQEEAETYFYEKQMPYLFVLFDIEREGINVNKKEIEKMSKLAEKDLEEFAYQIYEIAGIEFDIGSTQQLCEILFGWEKKAAIYRQHELPLFDDNGDPIFYKAGAKKGQQKTKIVKDKDDIIGYEFSGNKHLVEASFGFPILAETEKGQPATGEDELRALTKRSYRDKRKREGVEMLKIVLEYKRLAKLKSAFMDGLLEQIYADGKVHPSFNQCGTTSGRLSCSEPNVQQLPRPLEEPKEPIPEKFDTDGEYEVAIKKYHKAVTEYEFWSRYEIRNVFIPDTEEEVFVAHDFKNLEMMIMAHFSQDPILIDLFAKHQDVHGRTTVEMYKLPCTPDECKKFYADLRQRGKVINFLLIYGGTAYALASNLEISKEEAQELIDIYFETFQGVKSYMREAKLYGHKYEYVYTVLGRRRHLIGINSSEFKVRGYFERLSLNAPIQGSAADITISAQLLIANDLKLRNWGYKQKMQVHDEVCGTCPAENAEKVAERVKYLMIHSLPLPLNNIELDVDYGWSEVSYARAKS